MKILLKHGLRTIFSFVFFLLLFVVGNIAYAETPDSFVVEVSKNPANVSEAIDLTVKAVRTDGSIVTDYTGSILMFFDTDNNQVFDPDDFEVPSDGIYTFDEQRQGVVTFSKGLSVDRAGTFTLVVSDLASASIAGELSLNVGGDPDDNANLQDIVIISPTSGEIISAGVVNLLGKTDIARAPVQILINDELIDTEGETNTDGEFNIFIPSDDLSSGSNVMQVRVTNFDGQIIGLSDEVTFQYNAPATDGLFKGLTVSPGTTVKAGEKLTFVVETDAGVSSVQVKIGDLIRPLTKDSQTTFSNDAILDPGTYTVDVTIITPDGERRAFDDQAVVTVEDDIIIEGLKLVKDANTDGRIQLSWDVAGGDADNFTITYGTQRDLLTERQETTETTLLLDGLSGDAYFFQVTPVDADGAVIGKASDIVSIVFNETFNAAGPSNGGACNAQGLAVSTSRIGDKYYLVWPAVAGATNYMVYRSEFAASSISQMDKIGETTDTKFMYPFDPFAVEDQYAHYAVQAVCSDGQLLQLGGTRRVQVGPVTDLFFLFAITSLLYLLYILYGYSRRLE